MRHFTIHHSPFTIRAALLALALAFSADGALRAQIPAQQISQQFVQQLSRYPQLSVFVDTTPVVIEVPRPFVEVSRILPDEFAQNVSALPRTNRLLAWFLPVLDLRDHLDEKQTRCRSLQVQVLKEMEPVHYDRQAFKTLRAQTLSAHPMPQVAESGVDTLFAVLDLRPLTQSAGGQKILGMTELGPDSFTLCVASSVEGSDEHGGRDIETSISCATYTLINGKVILLTVSGPEMTVKELHNDMRLTREWLTLLRGCNQQ